MNGRRLRDESGQSLIITVLFLVILLGMAALVLDVGHAYLVQRRLQASADAAALAGAQALPSINNATALAGTFGAGGKNAPEGVDGVQQTISTKCLASAPGCTPANAIVVKESAVVPTVFGKVLGIDSLTVHATSTACSPCSTKALDVMLVLDRTGSMCTDENGKADPSCADMENARNGMRTFLNYMDPSLDHVGFAVLPPATSLAAKCDKPPSSASYNDPSSPYVLVPLSNDYKTGTSLNGSSDLVSTINCVQANGYTAYASAIDAAQAELQKDGRPAAQKVVILLSDGAANTGPLYYPASSPYLTQPCHQGITSAQTATAAGTIVYSIGYDLQHDKCQSEDKTTQKRTNELPTIKSEEALQGVASAPDDFYEQPDAAQLNTIYSKIAADILTGTSRLIDDDAS